MRFISKRWILIGSISLVGIIVTLVCMYSFKSGELEKVIKNEPTVNTQEEISNRFLGTEYINIESLKEYDLHYTLNKKNNNILIKRGSDSKSCILTIGSNKVNGETSTAYEMSLPVISNKDGIWVPIEDMDNYFSLDDSKIDDKVINIPNSLAATYDEMSKVITEFAKLIDKLGNDGISVVAISTSGIMSKDMYTNLYNGYNDILNDLNTDESKYTEDSMLLKQSMLDCVLAMINVHDAYIAGVSTDIEYNKSTVIMQWERINKILGK